MIDANQDKRCERNNKIVEMLEKNTYRTSGNMGMYCRLKDHSKCMYAMCKCSCHETD